jgi:SAM-dependent methyltransferase
MTNYIQRISKFYKYRIYPETSTIRKFVEFASHQVKPSDIILDAGSGKQQYRKCFSHARYESTDIEQLPNYEHDFICSLDNIPKSDNTYNAVLCTQVLEHVDFPQKVINEIYRVLKPGGRLFLSAPQGARVHSEPYHFFNFTKYGLASLFEQSGFDIIFIRANGGVFWNLGKMIRTLPKYISKQYKNPEIAANISIYNRLCWMIMVPLFFFLKPLYKHVLPFLCYYLDSLDRTKHFTLGYICYCTKPNASNLVG